MSVETLRECPYDLVVQRGALAPDEALRLAEHLATCPTCATMHALAHDLEGSCGEQPGDAALDAALADAVLSKALPPVEEPAQSGTFPRTLRPRARPRPATRTVWLAAAALLLFATIAAAAVVGVVVWRHPSSPRGAALHASLPETRSGRVPRATAPVEAPAPVIPAEAPVLPTPTAPGVDHPRDVRPGTAADLFAAANARRSRGDFRAAQALYRDLQRRFEDSPEAITSHVSLGRLLDEHGDAQGALAQFDGYLTRSPDGELVEEALFARGDALMQLHDDAAEREAWQRLLQRFPSSIYAARARRRLEELSAPAPPSS